MSEAEITIRVGGRWMRFTPEQIQDSRNGTMEFQLNENGTVSRGGHADQEMDLAAEEIAREMLHNG